MNMLSLSQNSCDVNSFQQRSICNTGYTLKNHVRTFSAYASNSDELRGTSRIDIKTLYSFYNSLNLIVYIYRG